MKKQLAAFLLFSSLTAMANDADRAWNFEVYLDDKQIGTHVFELEQDGDRTILETEAAFDVKFLFVTAFRYRHENREIWDGGCLSRINARTDNNGEELSVTGKESSSAFELNSKKGEQTLSGCIRSFAYWNPAILEADRLLNSQTGEYEPVEISYDGNDRITVGDQTLAAERYRISVERGDIFLWYTAEEKTWVALDAPVKGDRRIRYEAKQVPDSGLVRQLLAGA